MVGVKCKSHVLHHISFFSHENQTTYFITPGPVDAAVLGEQLVIVDNGHKLHLLF